MTTPALSIILPVYNRESTLSRAIRSVLEQDWTDWELVVVDDGSSDGSAEAAQRFAAQDPRIAAMRREHAGLNRTRNAGISSSRAPIVTFLDSDDCYGPGHLAPNLAYLAAHPEVGMLHGWVTLLGDPYVPDARDPRQPIHVDDCMHPGTVFVRRAVLEAIGGYPLDDFAGDYLLGERVRAAGFAIHRRSGRTYVYDRTGDDSVTKNFERSLPKPE